VDLQTEETRGEVDHHRVFMIRRDKESRADLSLKTKVHTKGTGGQHHIPTTPKVSNSCAIAGVEADLIRKGMKSRTKAMLTIKTKTLKQTK